MGYYSQRDLGQRHVILHVRFALFFMYRYFYCTGARITESASSPAKMHQPRAAVYRQPARVHPIIGVLVSSPGSADQIPEKSQRVFPVRGFRQSMGYWYAGY